MAARSFDPPQRAASGEVVVSAHGVGVVRSAKSLLADVSLELRAGEVLALLGPNGAGKSTLLSLLSGDMRPDSGEVRFGGRDISAWSLSELARRRSVLLQDNQLLFPFTVHQVVEMGRAPWRRTPLEDEDNSAIAEAIAAADIAHLGSRRVPSLSGGERARVAFARVMAGRTGVLMLDEPTAALDLGHQEAVLGLARERARAGDAVLVVLHDLNLAGAYADRIALLREGRVVVCDTPERVLTADIVSDVYRTPVEIIAHPVSGDGIVLPLRAKA
jgi:iron complex transport system ATP-binding protein